MTIRRAVIDPEKCDKSSGCPAKRACPAKAIEREANSEPYYVNAYCQGCSLCIAQCPKKAIEMV